ncbi:hypothetical protein BAMA_12425 [Bacillus manliponensis]|uniref:Uncharacterized protein n=1 Tax=Bacillus manliponensis TaxID=574376 RepID=A0A073JTH5_9BACI|nr:hypothetical protein [Bacillus manliponensis]KEK17542.1 hypothetical protein BAMA_12425 [Bacillus manliponensis]
MDPENSLSLFIFVVAVVSVLGVVTIVCNFIGRILDEHDRLEEENKKLRMRKGNLRYEFIPSGFRKGH